MSSRYVVTYAQNATPIHKPFWTALQRYAVLHQAEIVVVPGRYKNPTSYWAKVAQDHDWWAKEVTPYLCTKARPLCPNLTVHGDISIQPTATRPLTGFEAYAGKSSAIFGHPKIQLTTVPRPMALPRIFTTTGACTVPNYISGKAGRKAAAHHILGACTVEVQDDGVYHMRQLNATKNGHFYDLDLHYRPDGVHPAGECSLVLGDIHAELHTTKSIQQLLSVIAQVNPKGLILHDVLDFPTRGHHNIRKWWDAKRRNTRVREDLARACDLLDMFAQLAPCTIIDSNHHDHFDRWLQDTHPKDDPANAELWVRMWDHYYSGRKEPAFERYYKHEHVPRSGVHFAPQGGSVKVAGVQCGYHGHRGMNGARGSLRSYANLGAKTVVGHSHGPGILDGAFQVGVSAPLNSFDYRKGAPDGSLNTHCLIYPNGKRTLITTIDGRFRL